MSETVTVQEQLRQYRERVQRTLPLIANPIGWTGLVDTLELAANEIDRLARELREAKEWRLGQEEREAACCPEDVGFPEYIATLKAEVARLREASEDAARWRTARRLMCERKHENLHELIVDLTGTGFDDPIEDAAMDALIDAARAGGA